MSCARALFYGLGLSQAFVMAGVVLLYPPTQAHVHVYRPCVANGTLQRGCGTLRAAGVGLGLPCVALSVAAAAFVTTTYRLLEEGHLRTDCAFCPEAMAELGVWDGLFWFVAAAAHAVGLLLALEPGDALAAALSGLLMVHFLAGLCQAREGEDLQSLRTSTHFLAFSAGLALAVACVPDGYTNRYAVLVMLAVEDYFLGVGHLWDRSPRMETVANCRLCYAVAAALGTAAAYAWWHEGLRLAPAPWADD